VSVPSVAGTNHADRAAADHALVHPVILFIHQGLIVFLNAEFSPVDHMAYSSIFNFHIELIPAFFNFFITVASYGGIKSFSINEAHVVGTHFSQKISFTQIGIPARGELISISFNQFLFTKLNDPIFLSYFSILF
jgi:hypothetical protein